MDLPFILHGARWRAASGMLLKRVVAHMVEVRALFRMAPISFGGRGAARVWNFGVTFEPAAKVPKMFMQLSFILTFKIHTVP